MNKLQQLFVGAAVLQLLFGVAAAQAAEPKCETFFYVTATAVDVVKDPSTPDSRVAELQQDDLICLKRTRRYGDTTWGYMAHRIGDDGRPEKITGWVGMNAVEAHGAAAAKLTTTATTTSPTTTPAPARPAPVTGNKPDRQAEIAYWTAARNSNDPQLIRFYLEIYPNGVYAEPARALLDDIERGGKRDAERASTSEPDREVAKRDDPPEVKAKPSITRPTPSQRRARLRRQQQRAKARAKARQRRAQRRRGKKCRYESKFECMKRGGLVDDMGDCNARWICR